MKRRLCATLAVALLLLAQAAPARAGLADRVGATFGLMEAEFIQAFKPIEAVVVSGLVGAAVSAMTRVP